MPDGQEMHTPPLNPKQHWPSTKPIKATTAIRNINSEMIIVEFLLAMLILSNRLELACHSSINLKIKV
jgi:hypothetical protein